MANDNHDDHGRFASGNGSGGKAGTHAGHANSVPPKSTPEERAAAVARYVARRGTSQGTSKASFDKAVKEARANPQPRAKLFSGTFGPRGSK
jgi:hypothetical protein